MSKVIGVVVTSETVQPLIEALSELVSQIALIIIANKAANKAPPQELPLCVAGVQKSASTLVHVAKQLANDEYEDFPIIQEEINVGATDVEVAAKQLNEATVELFKGSEADRSGAWDSLGEAVRIMAQETSILLHIVYGAEIKKIFALSNYADGKLQDLLKAVNNDIAEKNPQLFANKVSAAMEDVQKLVQGLNQKASEEEDDPYARKSLEEAAKAIEIKVEPFVAHANELLAAPADPKAKQATVGDLKDLIKAGEAVGAPKPKNNLQSFIPELMDCVSKMDQVEPTTPEGAKEAQRMLQTLDGISRANRVTDMGPSTSLMNNIVDLFKDLDQIETMLNNPGVKPLGNVDPLNAVEPDAQQVLGFFKKMAPDPEGGRDAALQDADRLHALLTNDLIPAARDACAKEPGVAREKAAEGPRKAIAEARKLLDDILEGMDMTPEQNAQVKGAAKVNGVCIKLGAMVGSKSQNKTDIFAAAKNLTEMLGEMNALLGLAQAASGGGDGARGSLMSSMNISGSAKTDSQPKPKPKAGSAKAFAKKVAGPATAYKNPAQANLVTPDRGSVGTGFAAIGAGAEELKTLSLPKATKGAEMLPDTDPVFTGIHALGEQLAILAKSATNGDNDSLLKSGRAVHEQMKSYSALLRKKAAACKDPKAAHDLITLSNQLQNWSVQLKILSSVKASSGGGRDSDKALISMTQQIQNGLRGAPAAVLKALLAQ